MGEQVENAKEQPCV